MIIRIIFNKRRGREYRHQKHQKSSKTKNNSSKTGRYTIASNPKNQSVFFQTKKYVYIFHEQVQSRDETKKSKEYYAEKRKNELDKKFNFLFNKRRLQKFGGNLNSIDPTNQQRTTDEQQIIQGCFIHRK